MSKTPTWKPRIQPRLADRHLVHRWNELQSDNPAVAWRAVWKLVHTGKPAAVFLQSQLRSWRLRTSKDVDILFGHLDDPKYTVRESAMRNCMTVLAPSASGYIAQRLKTTSSPELKARLHVLLKEISSITGSSAAKRQLVRSVAVLERLNHPTAKQFLKRLAVGDHRTMSAYLAKSALKRMESHHAAPSQKRSKSDLHDK